MFIQIIGNTLNVHTGQWTSNVAGLGAGMDSFYEYLLKVNSATKRPVITLFT